MANPDCENDTATSSDPLRFSLRGAIYGGGGLLLGLGLDVTFTHGWWLQKIFHISWSTASGFALGTLVLATFSLGALLGVALTSMIKQKNSVPSKLSSSESLSYANPGDSIMPLSQEARVVSLPAHKQKDDFPINNQDAPSKFSELSSTMLNKSNPQEEDWRSVIADWVPVVREEILSSEDPRGCYEIFRNFTTFSFGDRWDLKEWMTIIEKYPASALFIWGNFLGPYHAGANDFISLSSEKRTFFLSWILKNKQKIPPSFFKIFSVQEISLLRDQNDLSPENFFKSVLQPWIIKDDHFLQFFDAADSSKQEWKKYFSMNWSREILGHLASLGQEGAGLAKQLIFRLDPKARINFIHLILDSYGSLKADYKMSSKCFYQEILDFFLKDIDFLNYFSEDPSFLYRPILEKTVEIFSHAQVRRSFLISPQWAPFVYRVSSFHLKDLSDLIEVPNQTVRNNFHSVLFFLDQKGRLEPEAMASLEEKIRNLDDSEFFDLFTQRADRIQRLLSFDDWSEKFTKWMDKKINQRTTFSNLWQRKSFFAMSEIYKTRGLTCKDLGGDLEADMLLKSDIIQIRDVDFFENLAGFFGPLAEEDFIKKIDSETLARYLGPRDDEEEQLKNAEKENFVLSMIYFFKKKYNSFSEDDRIHLEKISFEVLEKKKMMTDFLYGHLGKYRPGHKSGFFFLLKQSNFEDLFCSEDFSLSEEGLFDFFYNKNFTADLSLLVDHGKCLPFLLKNLSKNILFSTDKEYYSLFYNILFQETSPHLETFLKKAKKEHLVDFGPEDLRRPISRVGHTVVDLLHAFETTTIEKFIPLIEAENIKIFFLRSFVHFPYSFFIDDTQNDVRKREIFSLVPYKEVRNFIEFLFKYFDLENFIFFKAEKLLECLFENKHFFSFKEILLKVPSKHQEIFGCMLFSSILGALDKNPQSEELKQLLLFLFRRDPKTYNFISLMEAPFVFKAFFSLSSSVGASVLYTCAKNITEEDLIELKNRYFFSPLPHAFRPEDLDGRIGEVIQRLEHKLSLERFCVVCSSAERINKKISELAKEKSVSACSLENTSKWSTALERCVASPLYDRNIFKVIRRYIITPESPLRPPSR